MVGDDSPPNIAVTLLHLNSDGDCKAVNYQGGESS